MSMLIKREPMSMGSLLDDWMGGPLGRWMPTVPAEMQSMRMDMQESDAAYTVHAELPGVKKEDIDITLEDRRVTISAEFKKTQEQKEGEKTLHSERYFGKVTRSFLLEQDVDEGMAEANFTDGVLELRLPKKPSMASKRLVVH